jgi:acyl carrier protein
MTYSPEEICLCIKKILIGILNLSISPEEIDAEDKLVDGGLFLESLARINLILELEKFYAIKFDESDLNLENLNSITALAQYLILKMQNPSTGG